jgi:large subunit ribosomal protein L4
MEGEVVGDIELSDGIFGIEVNKPVLHAAVLNQLANRRSGTQSTKTKSEVRGGGKKPYRQKGTGRARHGSIRSAQWTKGGVIHGPKPRSFKYALPKKVRRLALKSALTTKVADRDIIVLDELALDEIKTKRMAKILSALKVSENTALVVIDGRDFNVEHSARNIPGVKTAFVNTINVYDILKHDKFIVTKAAVGSIEEVYAQ